MVIKKRNSWYMRLLFILIFLVVAFEILSYFQTRDKQNSIYNQNNLIEIMQNNVKKIFSNGTDFKLNFKSKKS